MRVIASLLLLNSALAYNPCANSSEIVASTPFCDHTLDVDTRARSLVKSLTQAEKISLLSSDPANGVPRLGIPKYQWWSEALHGVAKSPGVTFTDPTPYATSFPQIISTASTFNRTLWENIGTAISTEARAFSNSGHAGITFWTPNINIFRDPRWGRGQETPGEDPYVNAEYAAHYVSALQGEQDKSNYLKVSSCCKHYAAYSLENFNGVDRHHFDSQVTQQDMSDTFLPAFQSCVMRGKASSIMCSYNSVNGIPACANRELLTDIARNDWGFQGYITSDCGAVDDIFGTHKYTPTAEGTVAAVMKNGMDVECGGFLLLHTTKAIESGDISEDDLTDPLVNLFKVRLRLGAFDPQELQPYMSIDTSVLESAPHFELATEAARQAIVLLQNEDSVLPLKLSNYESIAVIGPNANITHILLGNYYGVPNHTTDILEGITNFAINKTVMFEQGCDVNSTDVSKIPHAVEIASQADVTIMVLGIDNSFESEGKDRYTISLPATQVAMANQVMEKAKGPVILIITGGGAVDLSPIINKKNTAIIWIGYTGQNTGIAVAETLFGANSPSGRLTQTWYTEDYINSVDFFNMHFRPNVTENHPGRTYRFYEGPHILFPFGFGLSYSKATLKWNNLPSKNVLSSVISQNMENTVATLEIGLKNNDKIENPQTVLVFVSPPQNVINGAPIKSLRNFERIVLKPHAEGKLTFNLKGADLCVANDNGACVPVAGKWVVQVGDLTAAIEVKEDFQF